MLPAWGTRVSQHRTLEGIYGRAVKHTSWLVVGEGSRTAVDGSSRDGKDWRGERCTFQNVILSSMGAPQPVEHGYTQMDQPKP